MEENIKERLLKLINESISNAKKIDVLDVNAKLIDDYGFDSVSIVSFIIAIEGEFGVIIDTDDYFLESFNLISNIVEYLMK